MTRKVTATFFMALDGVVQDPHKWSFPYWSADIAAFKDAELRSTEALLLGRITYEGFAAVWPTRTDPDGFADKFNSMPKHVVSTTMKKAEWTNSHIISKDVAREVSELKQQSGGDIAVHGSVVLVRWLLAEGLLDELRLLVYPLVLGQGKKLFDESCKAKLELTETKPLGNGVIAAVYKVLPATAEEAAPLPNPTYKEA